MAVVYNAFDTRLERNVAIKVILPGKEHSEKFLKRFEREAKALAQLSHPNIVKVIDYGEQEGLPYLVMEYLPGGTLKGRLTGKPMPWQEATRVLLLYFTAIDNRDMSEDTSRHFVINSDGEFHVYKIDMKNVAAWRGTVNQLRIDPTGDAIGAIIEIDYIRLFSQE